MAGYLLARAGVEVVVLEKHADFFRDFRGDTVHPSTLQVMHELGLLQEFLKIPHTEVRELRGQVGNTAVKMADFRFLPTVCKFVALMPQWDLLNFLAEQGRRYPGFTLMMNTEVVDVIETDGRIAGVRATTADGPVDIEADLVIGADGRHSTVREKAKLKVEDIGAPIDVLWLRLSRKDSDDLLPLGRIVAGKVFVTLNRDTYWQCAYVIPKGGFESIKARGLQALRDDIGELVPAFKDRTHELRDWDDVKLLTVVIDRLQTWWRPGLLCIGDAAHAMSPIGGVGINLAVQDAVASANILARPLLAGRLSDADLASVQRRREFPMRVIQAIQVFVQKRILAGAVVGGADLRVPPLLKLFLPLISPIAARVVGMGVWPEHIHLPSRKP